MGIIVTKSYYSCRLLVPFPLLMKYHPISEAAVKLMNLIDSLRKYHTLFFLPKSAENQKSVILTPSSTNLYISKTLFEKVGPFLRYVQYTHSGWTFQL